MEPRASRPCASLSIVVRGARTRRYLVPAQAPSIIREGSRGPKSRQTQSDPEGGIPSGSLEVLGRKQKAGWSAGAGHAVEGDHADLRWTLVAAIDHLLAHERGTIALSAGCYVLTGQRGQGADG